VEVLHYQFASRGGNTGNMCKKHQQKKKVGWGLQLIHQIKKKPAGQTGSKPAELKMEGGGGGEVLALKEESQKKKKSIVRHGKRLYNKNPNVIGYVLGGRRSYGVA